MIANVISRGNRTAKGRSRGVLSHIVKVIAIVLLAIVLFIAGTNLYTVASTRDDVFTVNELAGRQADAVVVLGASVYADGTPSDILADRLEVAVDLYKVGAAEKIIVSGDNRDSHYNESDAMKAYCVKLGVPADSVIVDHAGYDTYTSMYRARHACGADDVIVVTQAYHLYRALADAQGVGMTAQGVPADKGAYDNQDRYSLREVAARTKDFVLALFDVEPTGASEPMTL